MRKISFILLHLFLFACTSRESPTIYISNVSPNPIKNIEINWAEKNLLTLPLLNPGDTRGQSFYIKSKSSFFGPTFISWYNSEGKKTVKNFNFRKSHLPSISDNDVFSYVQLYLDQYEAEVMTIDSVDAGGKIQKMERLMTKYRDDFKAGHSTTNTALIRVEEPKRDTSVPYWIMNSY